MPVTITFSNAPLNVSLQIGDTAYYVDTTANYGNSGFTINASNVVEIGIVTAIGGTFNNPTITVANNLSTPSGNKFILFSKDNKANMSSILGYYAEVKFVNDSITEAELFSVGADMFESSK